MTFVVDVLPALTLLGVEDGLLEFLHESVNHLQRLANVLALVGLLKLVDVLVGNERIVAQRIEDVDRLERILLAEISIQIADVHETRMLAVANDLVEAKFLNGAENKLVEVIAGEHQQILGVETAGLAHHHRDLVDISEPLAVNIDTVINVVRKDLPKIFLDPVAPEFEHIECQSNKGIVAFGMDLLAEEMHQLVLTARDLVHVGGDVADLALGANLIEIDGEDAGELFHLLIIRRDIGVEDLGDLPLEQVGVAEEDAAQLQVHNQGGEQLLHGELGVLDEFEPHTNILDMILIH